MAKLLAAALLMFATTLAAPDKLAVPTLERAATCVSGVMTNSIFLKIDGIPGDSRDKCHANEIEPLSFQNSGTSVTVVKKIDASSPKLFIEGLMGTNIPEATLTVFQAGAPPRLFLYKMKHVIVASIDQMAGSANREIVTLRFQSLETQIQSTTGSAQSAAAPAGIDVTFTVAGVAGTSTASMISDGFASRQLRDFVINKPLDTMSPKLMQASVSGQHLTQVVITFKPRGTSDTFTYKLEDVLVAGATQQGNGSSTTEQVRFKPSKFTMQYNSSSSGTRPKEGWDVKANKKV